MEHRLKRTHPLYNLISRYESNRATGNNVYLDQRDFVKLVEYYQDEYLLDRAYEAATEATRQHPYSSELLLLTARLCLLNDRPYKAMSFLDKAEVITPFELEVSLLRARAFSELGEFGMACTVLADLGKNYFDAEDKIEIYLCEASVREAMRDFEGMFEFLSKALEIDPLNSDALERVWVSVELSKNYELSIKLHERLLDEDPFSYQAWFNLGHAYACLGEYQKAIDAIEYSFVVNEDFELGYLDCAELCCQEQQFDRALKIYREMIDRFGADSDDLVKVAECQYKMDDIDGSIDTLVEALQLDHYNDEVYYYLGRCFTVQNRYDNAVSSFIKAIELEDRREEYFAELAAVYAKVGEPGKADFYFSKATEIGPEQEYYWLQHCRFLIDMGQYEKAMAVIEEADYHTFGAELLYCKAICYFKLNLRKKAMKSLADALSEHFDMHCILFEICPELREDDEVCSVVRYYEGETVNSL